MAEAERRVALCKFGLPFSRKSIAVIDSEIEAGKDTSFILITKTNGLFRGHIARISRFVDSPTDPDLLNIAPEYYRDDKLSACTSIISTFTKVI